MPNRCEFGCNPKVKPMHRFPCSKMYPERFKSWVTLVGGKLESESDWECYKKKFVCDRHFVDKDRTRSNRLNALAIPTLHIPGTLDNQIDLQEASTSAYHLPITPSVNTGDILMRQPFFDAPSISTRHSLTATSVPAYSETSTRVVAENRVVLEHNWT